MKSLEGEARKEKRASQRIPSSAVVTYAVRGKAYEDFLLDISAGGLFIETNSLFSVGQHISLTFPLPGYQNYIKVTGIVVRTTGRGIGVMFDESIHHLLDVPEDEF